MNPSSGKQDFNIESLLSLSRYPLQGKGWFFEKTKQYQIITNQPAMAHALQQ